MNLHSMSIVLRFCRRPFCCYGVGIQCVDHCTRFLQTKVAKDDVANPEPTPASKRKKSGASANKQNGRDDKPKVTFWRYCLI